MEYFTQKKNIIRKLIDLPDAHVYYGTESLAGWVQDLFLSEQVDEVFVAYTRFHNVLSYEPCVELLPVPTNGEPVDSAAGNMSRIWRPLSKTSSFCTCICVCSPVHRGSHQRAGGAMVSMDAAQKNAEEMIES